jgi:FkbM family methyltransferase
VKHNLKNQSKIPVFEFETSNQFDIDIERKKRVDNWINASENSRFIYGMNKSGEEISTRFENLGYLVDGESTNKFNSTSQELHAMSVIMGVLPNTALARAQIITPSVVDAFSFYHFTKNYELAPKFIQGMEEEIKQNMLWYQELDSRFRDLESQTTYRAIVNFRLNWDIGYLKTFTDRRSRQYLEKFLNLGPNDVFYDVGAFTGDSYSSLTTFFGEFKFSYLFEPIIENYNLACENLKNTESIKIYQVALGDRDETVNLSQDGSSSSKILAGGQKVESIKLDNLDITPPNFIKVDIEGMEESFLVGASETIRRNRPSLAIAIYHNAYQLRKVLEIIDRILPQSEIFLRHYTEGFTETILYVIPNKI